MAVIILLDASLSEYHDSSLSKPLTNTHLSSYGCV